MPLALDEQLRPEHAAGRGDRLLEEVQGLLAGPGMIGQQVVGLGAVGAERQGLLGQGDPPPRIMGLDRLDRQLPGLVERGRLGLPPGASRPGPRRAWPRRPEGATPAWARRGRAWAATGPEASGLHQAGSASSWPFGDSSGRVLRPLYPPRCRFALAPPPDSSGSFRSRSRGGLHPGIPAEQARDGVLAHRLEALAGDRRLGHPTARPARSAARSASRNRGPGGPPGSHSRSGIVGRSDVCSPPRPSGIPARPRGSPGMGRSSLGRRPIPRPSTSKDVNEIHQSVCSSRMSRSRES